MNIDTRHDLTFAQAEGADDLPSQLELGQLDRRARTRLYAAVHKQLTMGPSKFRLNPTVEEVVRSLWVEYFEQFSDDFSDKQDGWVALFRALIEKEDYVSVLDPIQEWVRHPKCDRTFRADVARALEQGLAAYRLIDGRTIIPVTSESNADAVRRDLSVVSKSGVAAAEAHLSASATCLTRGDFADSVRESIHAVESIARTLAPGTRELGPALTKLSEAGYIHGGMKAGFASLYGYASDEKGVRHALLNDAQAKVSEADALYMFGSCAAFCAYLASNGRDFGLI